MRASFTSFSCVCVTGFVTTFTQPACHLMLNSILRSTVYMGMRVIPYMSHNTQYVHMHDLHGMAEL